MKTFIVVYTDQEGVHASVMNELGTENEKPVELRVQSYIAYLTTRGVLDVNIVLYRAFEASKSTFLTFGELVLQAMDPDESPVMPGDIAQILPYRPRR